MTGPLATSLLEREQDLRVARAAVQAAEQGRGGLLMVRGIAGAGKSTLLRAVRDEAPSMRHLSARGAEVEREFAFGVVHQLLDGVMRGAEPTEEDRLLSGAARAAGPLFGRDARGAGGGADISFAVLHGLYWIVASLSESQPLLVVIDDLQWADEPSRRFCEFLARRADELALLVVVGVRNGEGHDFDELIAASPDARVIDPAPLSLQATTAIISAPFATTIPTDAAHAARDATGGNPLLVTELARALAAANDAPSVESIRNIVPSSVARSVARRLRTLDAPAQRAAQAMAVLGDGLSPAAFAAAAQLDLASLPGYWDALGAIGLTEGDPPQFTHALIRTALAQDVSGRERDMLHARAARFLRSSGGSRERVVTHLLAAPALGEAWTVDVLREAARSASLEGAADLAARRLRRALEEAGASPDPVMLLELGMAELSTGDPRSHDHLHAVADAPDTPLAATALAMLQAIATGEAALIADLLRRSIELLDRDVDGLGATAPLLLQSTLDTLIVDPTLPRAEWSRLLDLATERDDDATLGVRAAHAAGRGASQQEVADLVGRFLGGEASIGFPGLEGGLASHAALAAAAVDRPDLIDPLLVRLQGINRGGTSRIAAYFEDAIRGIRVAAAGDLPLAEALLRGARERCFELTDQVLDAAAASQLANVLIRMGRLDEADALILEFANHDVSAIRVLAGLWHARRAELAAEQHRWSDALVELDYLDGLLAAWEWTHFTGGRHLPLRALALMRTGQVDEGVRLADKVVSCAAHRGVASDRAAGLLALVVAQSDSAAALELARQADAAAAQSPDAVLRADAALTFGIVLNRLGRRKEARLHLARARTLASRAGAARRVKQATEEFVLAGGRPQRVALVGVGALTPSERRTAEHAAAGLTNREIAERLFVTRKTVEHNLGRVFQKLEISSRTQLPEVLRQGASDDSSPTTALD